MAACQLLPEKSVNERENNTQQNAEDYHGCDWSVKAEIGAFNSDIAGEMAKPAQLVAQKPERQADNDEDNSNANNNLA